MIGTLAESPRGSAGTSQATVELELGRNWFEAVNRLIA